MMRLNPSLPLWYSYQQRLLLIQGLLLRLLHLLRLSLRLLLYLYPLFCHPLACLLLRNQAISGSVSTRLISLSGCQLDCNAMAAVAADGIGSDPLDYKLAMCHPFWADWRGPSRKNVIPWQEITLGSLSRLIPTLFLLFGVVGIPRDD